MKARLNYTSSNLDQLAHLIKTELKKPKTVLMIKADEFSFYWNEFKKQMIKAKFRSGADSIARESEQTGELKFAHNKKILDDSYTFRKEFVIEQVERGYHWYFEKRIQILFRSGIWRLWEKWDRFHFIYDQVKQKSSIDAAQNLDLDDEIPPFQPLSFKSSDIHVVFLLCLLCLLISASPLVIEYVWKKCIAAARFTFSWMKNVLELVEEIWFEM